MTLATALLVLALLVPTAAEQPSTVRFDMPGRSHATPSVAAAGSFVAGRGAHPAAVRMCSSQ